MTQSNADAGVVLCADCRRPTPIRDPRDREPLCANCFELETDELRALEVLDRAQPKTLGSYSRTFDAAVLERTFGYGRGELASGAIVESLASSGRFNRDHRRGLLVFVAAEIIIGAAILAIAAAAGANF